MLNKSFQLLLSVAFLTASPFAISSVLADSDFGQEENMGIDSAEGAPSFDGEESVNPGEIQGSEEEQGPQEMQGSESVDQGNSMDGADPTMEASPDGSEEVNQAEEPAGLILTASLENQTDGNYQAKLTDQKIQYQVYVKAFENSKDTGGSEPFRQDINIGSSHDEFTATFNNYDKQPGELLVAIAKKGNQTQRFCTGSRASPMKDGRLSSFPSHITVTLKTPSTYEQANGKIKNDSYPLCEVTYDPPQ